jgi:hypothetical protein
MLLEKIGKCITQRFATPSAMGRGGADSGCGCDSRTLQE